MPSRAGFKAQTKGGKFPAFKKDDKKSGKKEDPKGKGKGKGKKMPPWLMKGKKK